MCIYLQEDCGLHVRERERTLLFRPSCEKSFGTYFESQAKSHENLRHDVITSGNKMA